MGEIIFRIKFMLRVQFSGEGGKFSSGVIVQGEPSFGEGDCLVDNYPGSNHRGGIIWGRIFLEGNCPRTLHFSFI